MKKIRKYTKNQCKTMPYKHRYCAAILLSSVKVSYTSTLLNPLPLLIMSQSPLTKSRETDTQSPTSVSTSVSTADSASWLSLLKIWLSVGVASFGGPAAQIALMHRVVVDEQKWMREKQYLNALSFCMLLPGPEAMQLATYAGWRIRGVGGGLLAGLCFVIPGAAVVAALAALYVLFGQLQITAGLFMGIKAAVLVIVFDALLKVSRRALTGLTQYLIAAVSFIAIFFFALPFPLLIVAAALVGFWQAPSSALSVAKTATPLAASSGTHPSDSVTVVDLPAGHRWATARTVFLWLLIWWLPVLAVWIVAGKGLLLSVALFFSKLAIVTFGGAYAVLAYMAQDVVSHHQWLSAPQMMDALGLAETTPGPLILVTEFVGFLAGFAQGGMGLAFAAAGITLWVTFIPCFLWIFAGAPYMQWLSAQPRLTGALSAITAAVVGVILNLSLWFALHVLFAEVALSSFGIMQLWIPVPGSWNLWVSALTLLAAFLLLRKNWSVLQVLGVCAALALFASVLNN